MKGVTFYSLCCYNVYLMLMILLMYGSTAEAQQVSVVTSQIAKTIIVSQDGSGNFTTVQSAIDSIPPQNQNWVLIYIRAGTYKEKVTIHKDKGYILMQGEGIEKTVIDEYDAHQQTDTSATFTAYPDNIIIYGITFKNTYNIGSIPRSTPIVPAVAALMFGDKYVVLDSSFDGLQDTLFDAFGRHYYRRCFISGGIDFIFGDAQSLFQECKLNITLGIYAPERPYGTINAQGRSSPSDNGGFVYNDCSVTGTGKALLGRAWRPYSRVIFYRSDLSDAILPIGWNAWIATGREQDTTFVEHSCSGGGADMSQRVSWLKTMTENDILSLTSVSSINQEGWIDRLPIKF